MKRKSAAWNLHMGCGEGLVARLSLARSAKPAGGVARGRLAGPKKNGGRR